MVVDKIYDLKNLQQSHLIALDWVSPGRRILEFGPATGYVSRVMQQQLGCRVTGFEYSEEAARQAAAYCEEIIVGDIEDFDNWKLLDPPYDNIIFLDVLEHLRDPAAVLARCWPLLALDGSIVISVPNIAHWTVRRGLLGGRFDYSDSGILDSTHLRFFTRKSLLDMVEKSGFQVEQADFTRMDYPADQSFRRIGLMALKRQLNRLFDRFFPDAIAYQFVVKCSRDPGFSYAEAGHAMRVRVNA